MDFAVWHEGLEEGQGRWVIAVVEGSRFLMAGEDGLFYWKDAAECKLARLQTPDMPHMVVPVQAQQQAPAIVVAQPNRMMRRHPDN